MRLNVLCVEVYTIVGMNVILFYVTDQYLGRSREEAEFLPVKNDKKLKYGNLSRFAGRRTGPRPCF